MKSLFVKYTLKIICYNMNCTFSTVTKLYFQTQIWIKLNPIWHALQLTESYVFNTVGKEVKFSAYLKISEQEEDTLNKTSI